MSGIDDLRGALSEYHQVWRHPSLKELKVSETYDIENDFKKCYPGDGRPGCYVFLDQSYNIIYVGKSGSLGPRIHSYFLSYREHKRLIFRDSWSVTPRYIVCVEVKESFEAPSLEEFLIQRLKPPANTVGNPKRQ
jgi:hypothetical protein